MNEEAEQHLANAKAILDAIESVDDPFSPGAGWCFGWRQHQPHELAPDEVAYVRRRTHNDGAPWAYFSWQHQGYCAEAVKLWHPSWWEHRNPPQPCVTCGRPIAGFGGHANPKTCSRECSWGRPRKRVEHQPRACEHCGSLFTPTRSDARFCSGRCRVAAHRRKEAEP